MVLDELRQRFISNKCYEPMEPNELLDFARQLYIKNELSITQYRIIIKELEQKGAHFPLLEAKVEIT